MKKRLISLLLVLVTVLGMLPTVSLAASSEEEALGSIDIYNGGSEFSYLAINGKVKSQQYTYYNYVSSTGEVKEIPAYCVNPTEYGVPQTVAEGESIEYIAKERTSDPKVMGIIANGYPSRSLSELGLDNKYQAYYATKMALWCYLLSTWDINDLTVNPSLTGDELVRANKMLAAANDIYRRGTAWTEVLTPSITCTPDRDVAYDVTIDGKEYKQQVFTFWSKTWVCNYAVSVAFTDPDSVPEGTRIVDMDNKDITTITTSSTGDGYSGQFKVLYPAESVEGQTGSAQLSFSTDVYQYAVFYASCAETDKYGNIQNYVVDTDPTTTKRLSAYSNYSSNEIVPDNPDEPDEPDIPEPKETGLRIVKYETGTTTPLEGAVFEVIDPDGATVGTFATNRNGEINIPLTVVGNYTVIEREAPQHYLISEEPAQNVTVVYGKTAEVVFENDPYGNLRVEKVSNTGRNLSGAVITIQHIESGQTYSAKTNEAGCAMFTELKPGGYRIQETTAPDGYLLNDTVYTTNVNSGETSVISIVNEEKPGLRITKYDSKNMEVLTDITFEIFRDGVSIGKYKTNQLGEILLTDLEPGTYLVQEVASDSTHVINSTPQQIELSGDDGILELIFLNDQKPGIHLVKLDSTSLRPLPNAAFRIEQVGGTFSKEYVTDENGEIDLTALEPGAYTVTELEAPDGYLVDDAVRTIQINGNENAQFVFTNTRKPSLRIIKTSSDGSLLAGVQFRIAKIEDGSHYLDRITDTNGEINISDLEPGVYSVKETATTADHILDVREYHVELFAGQTSTLTIENQKRPNLYVYKNDADDGTPIENTVFTVRAADGHSVDEIKTDSTGLAVLENLLPGVYEISEKSVPSPWLKDAPAQLVTLYPNRDHTAYFENHKRPVIEIIKENAVTYEPLANVPFQVWYASNNTSTGEFNDLGVFYTDEDGRIELNGQEMGDLGLRDGWFRVKELEPLKGFAKADPDTQEAFIPAGQGHTFRFRNQPLSAICVWKYDSQNPNVAIEGAVFQIRYLSGNTSGTGGTVIGTFRTSANGSFTATGLSKGTYIIEELSSDGSHVIDTPPQTVYLSGEEQEVIQVYVGNSPKGSLLVTKVDDEGKPLSGVEFLVTKSDGTLVGDANGKFTTALDGTFLVEDIDPNTTLVVKETRQKTGYVLDEVAQTAVVKAGQCVRLQFVNHKAGNLVIHKLSSADKTPLEGVQFKLTYADGRVVDTADGKLSSNGLYFSNAEGQIIIPNVTGTIIATEVASIDGFTIDPNTRSQTVVINPGDDTQHLYFYNDPLCSLTLSKVDSVTSKPIPNTTFSVKDGNGNLIGRYTTGQDGTVTVTGLLPGSTVVVSEYKVPDAYVLNPMPQTITLKSGKNTVTSGAVNGSDSSTGSSGDNSLVFENDPKMTLTVKKYIKGTNYEPLAGVCFKIVDGSGKPVGSGDGTFYTNSAGEIVVEGLEPGTTVTAREISTVEGFVLDGEPKSVEIKASNKAPELIFWNERAGSLVIQKKSSLDGSPLAGVEFELTYAEGGYVDDANGHLSSKGLYTTDANGEIRISGVTGTIVVKEIKTIDGYTIDPAYQTQTVVVKPADTQTLTFYNNPIGGVEIIKVNEADKTERIPNTTFEIRKIDDELIDTITTDKNGRVFLSLEDGAYYAVEIEAGEGFKVDSTPIYFEVENGKTVSLTVTNKAFSGILIHKIDASTREGIYGVTFLLYDANKNPIGQYTSDDRGCVYIDDLPNSGRYYLRELENDGYIVDEQLKTVYVTAGTTTEITWENTAVTGQIQITKTSEDYNSMNGWPAGTPIPNTEFEIYNYKTGNLVDTVKTDKNGVAVSKPLPLGRYKIVESKAADFYGLDKTPIEVEIEFAGQIVKAAMTNKSLYTNVSIKKVGYTEVMPGQSIRYDFSEIGNNSTTSLTSFYWRDTLPTQAVRLDKIVTGTYNVRGSYKVVYKTNLNSTYRTMYDNLSTQQNYVLDASPAALGLASNECVTEFMVVFGVVPANFRQVEAPRVYCNVLSTLTGGTQFVNQADAGGVYNEQWIMATTRWATTVYKPSKPLPRTGY